MTSKIKELILGLKLFKEDKQVYLNINVSHETFISITLKTKLKFKKTTNILKSFLRIFIKT